MCAELTLGGAVLLPEAAGLRVSSVPRAARAGKAWGLHQGDLLVLEPQRLRTELAEGQTATLSVRSSQGATRNLVLPLQFGLREELERLHAKRAGLVVPEGHWLSGLPPGNLVTALELEPGPTHLVPAALGDELARSMEGASAAVVQVLSPEGLRTRWSATRTSAGWKVTAAATQTEPELILTRVGGWLPMLQLIDAGLPVGTPVSHLTVGRPSAPEAEAESFAVPPLLGSLLQTAGELQNELSGLLGRRWKDDAELDAALDEVWHRAFHPDDAGMEDEADELATFKDRLFELRTFDRALDKLMRLVRERHWSPAVARAALDELWEARDLGIYEDSGGYAAGDTLRERLDGSLSEVLGRLEAPAYTANPHVLSPDEADGDAAGDTSEAEAGAEGSESGDEGSLEIDPDAVASMELLQQERQHVAKLLERARALAAEEGASIRRKSELMERLYGRFEERPTLAADQVEVEKKEAQENPGAEESPTSPSPEGRVRAHLSLLDVLVDALRRLEKARTEQQMTETLCADGVSELWFSFRSDVQRIDNAIDDEELEEILESARSVLEDRLGESVSGGKAALAERQQAKAQDAGQSGGFRRETPTMGALEEALAQLPEDRYGEVHSRSWGERWELLRVGNRVKLTGDRSYPVWPGAPPP